MPPKRNNASAVSSPSSISPASVSASTKPSSAASSQNHTTSSLKPIKPSSSSSSSSAAATSTPSSSSTTTKPSSTSSASASSPPSTSAPATPRPAKGKSSSSSSSSSSGILSSQDAGAIARGVWERYVRETPQRVKLVDAFMAFLVVLGGVQFLYCVLAGNYPFNAFLSGFSATVGQFVLTASLRIQTNPANKAEFAPGFSDERAFADFVFGSLLLHFFCVNFIN